MTRDEIQKLLNIGEFKQTNILRAEGEAAAKVAVANAEAEAIAKVAAAIGQSDMSTTICDVCNNIRHN